MPRAGHGGARRGGAHGRGLSAPLRSEAVPGRAAAGPHRSAAGGSAAGSGQGRAGEARRSGSLPSLARPSGFSGTFQKRPLTLFKTCVQILIFFFFFFPIQKEVHLERLRFPFCRKGKPSAERQRRGVGELRSAARAVRGGLPRAALPLSGGGSRSCGSQVKIPVEKDVRW